MHKYIICNESKFKLEFPTLKEYLDLTADIMKVKPQYRLSKESSSSDSDSSSESDDMNFEYLPSVDFGPLDTAKAVKEIGWKTTPLRKALEKTIEFFEDAWHKYPTERPLDDFPKAVRKQLKEMYQYK